MIDIKRLREAPERTKDELARRDASLPDVLDQVLAIDARRREGLKEVEKLKAERNTASADVARRKKEGADATDNLSTLKALSTQIKQLDADLRDVESTLRDALLRIPNIPLADTPDGGPDDNVVLRTWGDPPTFDFDPTPHWDLGRQIGLFDLPRGAKVTGSGFPVYTGLGARLVRALINFMMDVHSGEHAYTEVWPPALVNTDSALGTGQLPDLENQMYITEGDLYLVPTAEVPVTNLHRDDIFRADQLPTTYAAYSPCFRREAGAAGKDTRGITRVHQFDKVELVRFSRPEDSPEEHELLLSHAESILRRLELPYRILALAAGDTGFASAKTYDVEVWAAGVGAWLEVSSASTYTDFQARRANIRYRPEGGGRPDFVHTLNASGLALPRTIIAILENNQQADGSVRIPEVLVPYMKMERLTPNGA